MMRRPPKALFLDRDGVINRDKDHVFRPHDIEFMPGVFELAMQAYLQGYLIIVVTNQSGIGRGLFTEEDFHALMDWMKKRFLEEGAELSDVFFCPYHPEHGVGKYKRPSLDRKPAPGMLLKAQAKHNINMAESILIGDQETDILAGFSAGVGKLLLHREEDVPTLATARISSLKEAIPYLK